MADLTAELVRAIVKDEINGLRQELQDGFAAAEKYTTDGINQVRETTQALIDEVRDEMREGFAATEKNTMDGINRVLETIQALTDEDRDEMAGITGRLRNHNERIAKLERLSNLQ